jgi:hypothetical protein
MVVFTTKCKKTKQKTLFFKKGVRQMGNKAPPDYLDELFKKISYGEPWVGKVTYQVHKRLKTPHFEYRPELHTGIVHLPQFDDYGVLAGWICHECGHFVELEEAPPGKLDQIFNELVNLPKLPRLLRRILVELYCLIFWLPRMRHELNAHREMIRLLQKIDVPLTYAQKSWEASEQLSSPYVRIGPILRRFQKRLKKLEDRMTQAAQNDIKTRSMV